MLLLLLVTTACAASAKLPNFVILFVDDLGYNEINLKEMAPKSGGYTGYNDHVQTPHLAQFAREGMVFTAWYSGWSVCSPSRASMLTGRLPPRTGIDSVASGVLSAEAVGGLPLNETTFAEHLSEAGYATGMVGKWHLGTRSKFMPNNRGFDMWLGIPFSADMGTSVWHPAVGNAPMQPTPLPLIDGTKENGWKVVEQPVALQNLTARYVERASLFISENAANRKPFVLYIPFNHVHNPQFCSKMWCNTSVVHGNGAAIPTGHGGTGSAMQEMDHSVGEIMAALKTAGVDDDTLVFFTSDNGAPSNHQNAASSNDQKDGEFSNHPLSGYKGSIQEGGIRMPAMIRWPGKVQAGTETGELAATYDIFTTMLTLAHVALPTDRVIDGQDLSPIIFNANGNRGGGGGSGGGGGGAAAAYELLTKKKGNGHVSGHSKHRCIFMYHSGVALDAVRCGNYKYNFAQHQLYDLIADPGESSPLPVNQTASLQAIVANLTAERSALLASVVPVVDQVNLGTDPAYSICSDPKSTLKYPHLPNCTMSPNNWINPSWWPPVPPPSPSPSPPRPRPVPNSAYIGCFWDKGYPTHGGDEPCDLPVVKSGNCPKKSWMNTASDAGKGKAVTLEECQSLCNGHKYFGVQNGGSGCFCGPTYGRYGQSSNCTMPCPARGGGRICGGPGCNSIYLTANSTIVSGRQIPVGFPVA